MTSCIRPVHGSIARLVAAAGVAAMVLPATSVLAEDPPLAAAMAAASEDIRVFNDHVVTLASPFMEGRVPGSNGMEVAKDYMEFYLRGAGLEPGFSGSYRQAFPLGGTTEVTRAELAATAGGRTMSFDAGSDFTVTSMGIAGEADAPIVFVGYSIERGPDDYASYNDDDDLTGKVAMVLRFEPMDEDGKSLWASGRGPWSARASFRGKLRAAEERGAAAIIVVNTPGADDPRVGELQGAEGSRSDVDIPVLHMSTAAAERLVSASGASLMDLRRQADEGRAVVALGAEAELAGGLERKPLMAENVGGLLRGRGELADELIIVGGHLDHLGMGFFGSRSGPGELHPGADDNATGAAAVLMIGEKLANSYKVLPDDMPLRSVLFVGFSGEESGLNGSRFYVNNPIVPLEKHALMINFDMIGRVENRRLSVSGANTAAGFGEWLQPMFDESPLEIIQAGPGGGSDHLPFMQRQVPILFAICADFHADYHTPQDVSWKINRESGVMTVELFHKISLEAAKRSEAFIFSDGSSERAQRPAAAASGGGRITVRVGVVLDNSNSDAGILLDTVTDGGAAAAAGLRAGDRMVSWGEKEIGDVQAWMGMLSENKPGDVVNVGIVRANGDKETVSLTLKARG